MREPQKSLILVTWSEQSSLVTTVSPSRREEVRSSPTNLGVVTHKTCSVSAKPQTELASVGQADTGHSPTAFRVVLTKSSRFPNKQFGNAKQKSLKPLVQRLSSKEKLERSNHF